VTYTCLVLIGLGRLLLVFFSPLVPCHKPPARLLRPHQLHPVLSRHPPHLPSHLLRPCLRCQRQSHRVWPLWTRYRGSAVRHIICINICYPGFGLYLHGDSFAGVQAAQKYCGPNSPGFDSKGWEDTFGRSISTLITSVCRTVCVHGFYSHPHSEPPGRKRSPGPAQARLGIEPDDLSIKYRCPSYSFKTDL
jgi:hypothetical protein